MHEQGAAVSLTLAERMALEHARDLIKLVADTLDCRDANGRRCNPDRRQENVLSIANARLAAKDIEKVLNND